MKISETCIGRPVFAWVITFIIILLGVVASQRLPLQEYPKIDRSFVTIETQLPGAGPEIVESLVTKVVEDAMAGLEGIANITSITSTEDSKVSVEFIPGMDINHGVNNIRDALAKSRNLFPDDATDPTLSRSRAEEKPVIILALTSETVSVSDLNDYAIHEIQKDLESLPGVARVDVVGVGEYKMKIFIDPIRMAAYNIAVADVVAALKGQNIEKPAGKIVGKDREYLVTTIASLDKPEEFENVVVLTHKENTVRIKDIGRAEIVANDRRSETRFNGNLGVSISVVKSSAANPIDVAKSVKSEVEKIKKRLPEGMLLDVGSDKTKYIEKSLDYVKSTIWESIFLVVGVVFLFLRSMRASLVPLVTIPVSLIGTLFLMYLLGFSINKFTLLAMVLAIGLVVDDAIVILENIHRHIERGLKPFQAAIKGVHEISFSIVAMTLTLAAVYAPVSLAQGFTGKMLKEFSITLAGSVLLSGVAALTLSPMMCARLLKSHSDEVIDFKSNTLRELQQKWQFFKNLIPTDRWLLSIENKYEDLLRNFVMKKRFFVSLIGIGFAMIGLVVFQFLSSELTPKENQWSIYMEGQAPQTATLEYTSRYVKKIDEMIAKFPQVEKRISSILNPGIDITVDLYQKPEIVTDEISAKMRQELEKISGVEMRVTSGSSGFSGDDSRSIQFVIRGNKSYQEIKDIAMNLNMALMNQTGGMVSTVLSDIRGDTTDYTVTINRNKTAAVNVQLSDVASTIDSLIRGKKAHTFKKNGRAYDVFVEIEKKTTPDRIHNIYVKSGNREETLVPLSDLVSVDARSGPVEIHRFGRMRSISFTACLKPGYSMGDGVKVLDELAKEVLPNDMKFDYTGETKRFLTENNTIRLVFGLALAFIYLVMAAQFESWRDPFIILLSVPLSLSGAVITLGLLPGATLNLYSNIGLITLIGLITKHGILMVDFANALRAHGDKDRFEAITFASVRRLRAILMTTFAMVLGAVPLALASGEGSESLRQLGWTIVGGMTIGTIFTLFVLPSFYTYITASRKKSVFSNHNI